MGEYRIILPNEKERTARYISVLILCINLFVFVFYIFYSSGRIFSIALAGSAVSAVALLLFFFKTGKENIRGYPFAVLFLLLAICWMIIGKYLVAVFLLAFAMIGIYALKKLQVVFRNDAVIYPSFPKKIFEWHELSNVILKDRILTIDCKNNKLIQVVIDSSSAETIVENEFNEYCRKQLVI